MNRQSSNINRVVRWRTIRLITLTQMEKCVES